LNNKGLPEEEETKVPINPETLSRIDNIKKKLRRKNDEEGCGMDLNDVYFLLLI